MAPSHEAPSPATQERGEAGRLAQRLSDARSVEEVGESLADHLASRLAGAAVRVYVVGPGDRCGTCPRARECPPKDRCLHLAAGTGAFAQPPLQSERVPRTLSPWSEALASPRATRASAPPSDVAAPARRDDSEAVLLPLRSGGETFGVAAIRLARGAGEGAEADLAAAGLLAGAAMAAAVSRAEERRRFEQLLLVGDLGRKVGSILNIDLLLRQAVVDIQRTFGYRHVSVFVVDPDASRATMRAQSSRYERAGSDEDSIGLEEGIVGRAARSGRTVRVDDVSAEADYVDWWPDTKSEIAVPVRIGGVVEAVVNVESDRVRAFTDSDVAVLETAANQLAIAIENARLFGRVKRSEEEYRALVESSPVAILQVDREGRIAYANPAVEELTGLDRETLLSRLTEAADLAVSDDRPALAEAIARGLAGTAQRGIDFRAGHADGRERWVSSEIQPLADAPGRQGVLLLARNVTRERELQDQLQQAGKLKAMGEMVSGVAHELNNPLSGVLGYAQLFLARPTEEWGRGDMEKIESNARRCKKIVENLLAFSRQSRSERRHASLNEVLDAVLALNEYPFRLDGVEIVRDLDPRLPQVSLDVGRWQQVFINLATNAREAMVEAGSDTRRITFATRLREDAVEVRVEDTGPGIAPEHLDRVFEPFFTTKPNGTGLGLGLCYGIVSDHGGTIAVESEPGHGAVFTIRMPRPPEAVETPTPERSPRERAARAGKGLRALVVDDEQVVRDVVTHVLELHGYEVHVASDAREALARLEGSSYDVLLTDLRMPGPLDGFGLARRLLETRPALARRMVFMTGDVLEDDTTREIERLGLAHVRKPFDIRELARLVNDLTSEGPLREGG
jgi:two-component system NtrC family sensor kinase